MKGASDLLRVVVMTTAMTSRQRVTAAFNHSTPDRTPIFEYVLLSPIADAILGRPFAAREETWLALVDEVGWEEAVRREAVDRVEMALRLGHDMIYCVPSPEAEEQQLGAIPVQSEDIDDDPVERVRERNAARRQKPPVLPDRRYLVFEKMREEMARRGVDLLLMVPTYDHGIWTDVDLMQTMLLDPEVAAEHFALATESSLRHLEKYLQIGCDVVGVGGDFAGNRPLISRDVYCEFIVPEVARVSQRVHAEGKWAVNASDGHLWPVIEDFLFGCEADGYIEIDLHAGMDLGRLKSLYGDRTTLLGNMDCGTTLSFAPPDEVVAATIACLEAGWGNGGHIFTASNAITASVPLTNYLAMVNGYRDYFNLERLRL